MPRSSTRDGGRMRNSEDFRSDSSLGTQKGCVWGRVRFNSPRCDDHQQQSMQAEPGGVPMDKTRCGYRRHVSHHEGRDTVVSSAHKPDWRHLGADLVGASSPPSSTKQLAVFQPYRLEPNRPWRGCTHLVSYQWSRERAEILTYSDCWSVPIKKAGSPET